MTAERIQKVVEQLGAMADTNFSDYAGFHFEGEEGEKYRHSFIVNDQMNHSSNFTLQLENFSDAIEIVQKFKGLSREKAIKELRENAYYKDRSPIYLHYIKLLKDS